jgi:hypothetical protein
MTDIKLEEDLRHFITEEIISYDKFPFYEDMVKYMLADLKNELNMLKSPCDQQLSDVIIGISIFPKYIDPSSSNYEELFSESAESAVKKLGKIYKKYYGKLEKAEKKPNYKKEFVSTLKIKGLAPISYK